MFEVLYSVDSGTFDEFRKSKYAIHNYRNNIRILSLLFIALHCFVMLFYAF